MVNSSVKTALSKASAHVRRGEVAQAVKLYEEVLRKYPGNKAASQALSMLLGSFDSSAVKPPQNMMDRLSALYDQQEFDLVIESSTPVLETYPDAFLVWNLLGAFGLWLFVFCLNSMCWIKLIMRIEFKLLT